MRCGQRRAKCTAEEVARPGIADATPLLPYCCWKAAAAADKRLLACMHASSHARPEVMLPGAPC
eukprot:scaffold58382_cov15-Tisochrysis_lutea.AAC.1